MYKTLSRVLRRAAIVILVLLSSLALAGGVAGSVSPSGRTFRLVIGLSVPWLAAALLYRSRAAALNGEQVVFQHTYWNRLAVTYAWAIVLGIILWYVLPYLEMFLMDSGLA